MHWETEYELEQENNQMTNFLHLKINIGNNNLTVSIYHKAVETDTHILNTFQPFGRKQESHIQIHAKQNKTENIPITSPPRKKKEAHRRVIQIVHNNKFKIKKCSVQRRKRPTLERKQNWQNLHI